MPGLQRAGFLQATAVLCAGGLVGWGALELLDGTLFSPRFSSGWALTLVVFGVVCLWWSAPKERSGLARRLRIQTVLAALVVAGFLVHAEARLPLGWIETGLFGLAIAFLGSSWVGGALLREAGSDSDQASGDARLARWIRVHAGVVGALLGLALFHGLFVHAHGWLAHLFLYSE